MELEKIEFSESEKHQNLQYLKLMAEFQNRVKTLSEAEVSYLKDNIPAFFP